MPRSQAAGGSSLAQIYDTVGTVLQSSAEIRGDEITLNHEMGQLLFAEGFRATVRRIEAVNIAQNSSFNAVLENLPGTPFRLNNFVVFSDDVTAAADLDHCTLSLRDLEQTREVPVFQWETADGIAVSRFNADAALGIGNFTILSLNARSIQTMATINQGRISDPSGQVGISELALRGRTGAFGAGTRNIKCNIALIFSLSPTGGSIRSRGLALPSW